MITVIILLHRHTRQHYIRLHPGAMDDNAKEELLIKMQAVNAGAYDYSAYPNDCNVLFFQEFESLDTAGVYYNINGDRPIYDLIVKCDREPEYYI